MTVDPNPLCCRDGGRDEIKSGDWQKIDPPLMFREVFLGIHRAAWVRTRWRFKSDRIETTHTYRLPSGATIVLASAGGPVVKL